MRRKGILLRGGAVLLTVGVLCSLLGGCAGEQEAAKPSSQATTQPTTAPEPPPETTHTGVPVTEKPEEKWVQYHHRGLHFTLGEGFTTMEHNTNLFTFTDGDIEGSVECYPLDHFQGGCAFETSQDYASYLLNTLAPSYDEAWMSSADGAFHYVVFQDEIQTLVRGLYIYEGVGWSLGLSCPADKDLTDRMVRIITGGWVQKDQIPYWLEASSQVECQGLTLSVPGLLEQKHYDYGMSFTADNCRGGISTGSVQIFPQRVENAKDMASWEWEQLCDQWTYLEPGVYNGVDYLLGRNEGDPVMEVYAYYVGQYRYWVVKVRGEDLDTLLNLATAAKTDDLGYFRTLSYNLRDYECMDDLLMELGEAGQQDWGTYTLELTGLSQTVELMLRGTRLLSIRVGEVTVDVAQHEQCGVYYEGPNGEDYTTLKEFDGSIILNNWSGSVGHTWIITGNKVTEFHPEKGVSTMVFVDTEGKLRYQTYALRYNDTSLEQEVYRALNVAISRDEFHSEDGTAQIWGGEVCLTPVRSLTADDVYDLDALFEEAKENGLYPEYDNLEQLLYRNLLRYPK